MQTKLKPVNAVVSFSRAWKAREGMARAREAREGMARARVA